MWALLLSVLLTPVSFGGKQSKARDAALDQAEQFLTEEATRAWHSLAPLRTEGLDLACQQVLGFATRYTDVTVTHTDDRGRHERQVFIPEASLAHAFVAPVGGKCPPISGAQQAIKQLDLSACFTPLQLSTATDWRVDLIVEVSEAGESKVRVVQPQYAESPLAACLGKRIKGLAMPADTWGTRVSFPLVLVR